MYLLTGGNVTAGTATSVNDITKKISQSFFLRLQTMLKQTALWTLTKSKRVGIPLFETVGGLLVQPLLAAYIPLRARGEEESKRGVAVGKN